MSKIEVNTVAPQCGTTLTLGESGDTVTLGSGASQSGFGRTGTVDWDTTAKTASFTAVSGNGYFVNTTSGTITVTLPAGSAGDIVSLADYAATWQTNAVTVTPNGTDKIGGINDNATLNTEGQSVTFVYSDSTQGWLNTMDSTSNARGTSFLTATGGTITTCGNCKIHTFTGPGTFTVCKVSTTAPENIVSYLVVAGGGSGGVLGGGGGGAGGYREVKNPVTPYTASPLDGYATPGNLVTVTAQSYPITVGGGGASSPTSPCSPGNVGSNSIFSTITSAGGGYGGGNSPGPTGNGGSGGSGGGGNGGNGAHAGGSGNTPPVSPPQGNSGGGTGGCSSPNRGSGGGGATTAGSGGGSSPGQGGTGATTSISASPTAYAGGAGGGSGGIPSNKCNGAGSSCGTGGVGGNGGSPAPTASMQGATNRGGGGGGGELGEASGTGGSGIVIIRYKFQN